jgi:hypothetical protein
MRGPHFDSITVIALVLMTISGAIAIQRYMAEEPIADIRLETVRY